MGYSGRDLQSIVRALENSDFEWRTLRGVARETGIPLERVKEVITHNQGQFIRSSGPSAEGEDLYTTRRRYRGEVQTLEEMVAVSPSPPAHDASGPSGALGSRDQTVIASVEAPPRVFLAHGHNREWRAEVARFMERLSLEVIILDEQPSLGQTIIEKFEQYADVRYAVALLTADDRGGRQDEPYEAQRSRARQNVIFELGYFVARLGRRHVCALHQPGVEIPSDYQGVLYLPLDAGGAWQLRLVRELSGAGLPVNLQRL